jgi:hypothetical protein
LSFVNEQTGNQERIVEKIRTPAEWNVSTVILNLGLL